MSAADAWFLAVACALAAASCAGGTSAPRGRDLSQVAEPRLVPVGELPGGVHVVEEARAKGGGYTMEGATFGSLAELVEHVRTADRGVLAQGLHLRWATKAAGADDDVSGLIRVCVERGIDLFVTAPTGKGGQATARWLVSASGE